MTSPLQDSYEIIVFQDVHWGDMDTFQHVNNTVYFRYFEDARMAFFEKFGINDFMNQHQIGPILATTNCQFKLPISYPDRIHIAARHRIVSPKKINMECAVYSEHFSNIAAEGEALIVYYDYSVNKSCEIPPSIIETLNKSA